MTKQVLPIIQHARDLRLAIVTEDVLPATSLLQEASLKYGDWLVHFAIIGASHRIRIQRGGDFVLEEMLACVDISSNTCWHYHDFTDLAAHQYQRQNYVISTHFSDDLPPELSSDGRIEYRFPAVNNLESLTRIEWTQDGDILRWWTLHTYAETENIIAVHTQSEFHFTE